SSLAFGPQFGGMIDYVVREGTPNTAPRVTTALSTGSYGLLNSFTSVGGGTDHLTYYGFIHGRRSAGWRPNSDYRQASGYARVSYAPSAQVRLSAEYTAFGNRIHMPGGLTDSAFDVDPRQSLRARNWLTSPWNIAALRFTYDVASRARIESTLSYLNAGRSLVWRNEDGGPGAADAIDPVTGALIPREV